ncbi:MAG: acylphosphatase [Proteobacteria bacterium]|nr:acylphosphatase [Pseudomonadota bacterium]
MPRDAIRLVIEGRVQGVGFRWWTVGVARRLGIAGWVRNRRDGAVEILALGDQAQLLDFLRTCSQGPVGATVTHVHQEMADDDGSTAFEQRETV